jgi:DNA processing protein
MSDSSPAATALMALMKLRGVGRRAALRIVDARSEETDVRRYREFIAARMAKSKLPEEQLAEAWQTAEEEMRKGDAAGIRAYSLHDPGYPARLREIPDPPAVLFVKGNLQALHRPKTVAIVGTREPTTYGETVARRSGKTAVEAGFAVVSGLAHGCDTYGHEGCLDASGIGVAVMAHGLDKVYPAANRDLAARLLDSGGALVSEYPIGMAAARTAFAERDRIQSGLSDGVFVIETDVKGGTMHTVRFARDQRRALACVSHPEKWRTEDKTKGNQMMIAEGWAMPVPDGPALLEFLDRIGGRALSFEATDRQKPPSQGSLAL